jgi:hypothetical protein
MYFCIARVICKTTFDPFRAGGYIGIDGLDFIRGYFCLIPLGFKRGKGGPISFAKV